MQARTIEEALKGTHPTYIGGGTDIMPLLKNHVRDDSELVFLHKVEELKELRQGEDGLYLGAGVTLWDVAESPLIRRCWPALAQAAGATASPQIRNIATVGGNIMQDRRCIYFNQSRYWRGGLPYCFKTGGDICHQIPNSPVCRAIYYSDVATALVLYDAQVEYIEDGQRKQSPVLELIRRHSEANGLACDRHLPILVVRFKVPCQEGEWSGFHKYAMRATIDFPLINFALRRGGARPAKIVAGAVAPWPVELPETAKLLQEGTASEDEIISACEAELKKLAMPIKEACISPARKRDLFAFISMLL